MGGRRKPQFSAQSKLKPLEEALIAAVEAGEDFRPSAAQLKSGDSIRGGLLRAMLMETPLRHHPARGVLARERAVRVTPHGIRIVPGPPRKEAKRKSGDAMAHPPMLRIAETLDLAGIAGEGGAFLPPLEFSHCIFDEEIVLAGARLQSLVLKDSRFASLSARGAKFNGSVVLDGCRPRCDPVDEAERHFVSRELVALKAGDYDLIARASVAPLPAQPACECASCQPGQRNPTRTCGHCCVINFGSAIIAGTLQLTNSYFRAPGLVGRQYSTPSLSDRMAARLVGVRVSNSVWIIRSTIIGQMSLASADVTNEVWILGGRFVASAERRTVDFQLARIGGLLTFGAHAATLDEEKAFGARAFPVMVIGQVSGIGMTAGEIWISEGFYFGHDRPKRGSQATINFPKSDIKRTFKIGTYHEYQDPDRPTGPAWIHGEICVAAANIEKNFEVHGASYEGIAQVLDLEQPFFSYFGVASAETPYLRLSAHGLKVDRRFYISRGLFRDAGNWCRDPSPLGSEAEDASAAVCLRDAIPAAVDLWKSTVGTGVRIGPGSDCIGAIRLNSCVIGREAIVDCRTVVPGPADWAATARTGAIPVLIDISESTIKGHLRIGRHEPRPMAPVKTVGGKKCMEDEAITVEGAVSLESTNVQGGLLLGHITFDLQAFDATGRSNGTDCDPAAPENAAVALNLRDCVCGSDLEVHALRWALPPVDLLDICQAFSAPKRFERLRLRLSGARFADIEQGPHAVIDLRGLHCGLLVDGFGAEWGLIYRLQLRLAGMRIGDVEPACQKAAHSERARVDVSRLRWLAFQNARQQVSDEASTPADPEPRLPFFSERYHCSRHDDFVPQAYDVFSTVYRKAGEDRVARAILLEKKDVQNALHFWQQRADWKTRYWKPRVYLPAIATAAGLWWVTMRSEFVPNDSWDLVTSAALLTGGVFVFFFWPFVAALFQMIFKWGFLYGLSPDRALAVFLAFILIGWVGTHYARNGGFAAVTDWASEPTGESMRPEIALVLDVDYQPGPFDPPQKPPEDSRAAGTHREGQALHAQASPCNLDVSSLLYAVDVFIPLIDLDQERRCTVRDARTRDGDDSYFGWRFFKALYELLGWVVTSLGILTITGVLRRDLER